MTVVVLWPKNVTNQLFQIVYYLISILAVYPLGSITMNDCKDDPTLLQITTNGRKSKDEHEVVTNERIVQFVMESGFHVTVSDLDNDQTDDEDRDFSSKTRRLEKEVNTVLTFFVNPNERQAFVDAFEVALDQLRGYGFALSN